MIKGTFHSIKAIIIRPTYILTIFLILMSCSKDDAVQLRSIAGSIELVDEYGQELADFSGVEVTIITDNGEQTAKTDEAGSFSIDLKESEIIERITYEKEGFARQQFTEDFQRAELQTVEMIQISTLEIYNLAVEEMDCGSTTCFKLSFDAHRFYTDKVDKRYFDLHAYHQNQLVGTLRFFSFQETQFESNQITPLTPENASIEVEVSGVWFLSDFSSGTEIELRVYGATAHETYLYYDLDTEIDNSLNPIHGQVFVSLL